jgi:hypothetical protein
MTRRQRLTADEREQIYERRIRQDILAGALPSRSPVAMFVAGQPGAGVSSAAALLRRELRKTAGPAVSVSAQRLLAYHPGWRDAAEHPGGSTTTVQGDVNHWFDRIVQDARKQRLHLLIEDELQDAKAIHRLAVALRKDAYVVQAVFVGTNPDESRISVMAGYDIWRERGLPPNFVSTQEHDAALANVRIAIGLLEDRRAVDGLRVIDRGGSQLYENRLAVGEWIRAPRAQATLDIERDRVRPPKDVVKFAMRWETLVQRLVHDAAVSRDIASQALAWRNDAVARCEATPATAQMLQWAREGAAFRTMDRFEFEKEFPHHARAVKSLGMAVLEAEKYSDEEGARLLFHARENIAQRIERGDMARIAARERTQEPPTR